MKKYLLFYMLTLVSFATLNGQNLSENKITDLNGNENPIIDCNYPLEGGCLTLKLTTPKFYQTTDYKVVAEDYKPNGAFNSGTAINADADDLYLKKVVIPFNFCYFGITYNEVILGTNGTITFNSKQLGNVDYPNIQSTNPSSALPLNSIFGVAQDLVFSKNDDSEIYYSVVGPPSCRQLVINFYKGRMVGCDQTSTSQIVLNECSGNIEIYIEDKPLPCSRAKFKESLVGIINADGTKGYSPPGRNTGVWDAHNEAWRFSAQGSEVLPKISWYNSDNKLIGSGATIKVCPEKNEIYTAKASFLLCGSNSFVLEDKASVSFAPDYPLAKNYTKVLCGNIPLTVNLADYLENLTPQIPADLLFSFHNSLVEAQSGTNPQPKTFELNNNRIFYVRVQNPTDPTCFRTSVLTLNLISKSLLTSKTEICDFNNDGVENDYLLAKLNTKFFSLPLDGTLHYFISKSDADNKINEITKANISDNSEFYIRYDSPTCSQVFGPVKVNFLPSPIINSPIDYKLTTCDLKDDGTEPFKFIDVFGAQITTDPNVKITFFSTFEEAFSGRGSQLFTIKEGKYRVFARVEEPGGCFSIATINLDIIFTKVEAKDKSVYICFDGSQDLSINLDDYSDGMLVNPLTGIIKGYYPDTPSAEASANELSNLYTFTDNGDLVTKTIIVKFTDETGCYALKQINLNFVHAVIKKSKFDVCDFLKDGQETVNLSNYNTDIIGSQSATVAYFLTANDAANNSNIITSYLLKGTGKLFVKITSFGCSNIFEINFKLTPTPVVKTEVIAQRNSICDNNADKQENFDLTQLQPEIYSGTEAVYFSYYTSYNPTDNTLSGLISAPSAFPVKGESMVYAKVNFTIGECFSVSTIKIKLNFLPAIILKSATLQKCDFDFNLNETFNLEDAIPQIFDQQQNSILLSDTDVTFFATEANANDGAVSKQIGNSYTTSTSNFYVYARFSSKTTSCYSVASILLQSFLPPKALKSTIDNICDDNLDGLFNVNLLNFTDNMVNQISIDNHFSFYATEAEAKSRTNAIANPEDYRLKTLPARVWVRVENISDCFDTAFVNLNPGVKVKLLNYGPFTVTNTCDIGNDGIENIDLTQFQSTIYSGNATYEYFTSVADLNNYKNKISDPKAYSFNQNSGPKKVYLKISAAGFCPEMVEINLTLKKTPIFSLPDYYFCPEASVDIKPDFSKLDIASFEWINPSGKVVSTNAELLKVNVDGIYKINVTANNGCSFSTTFKVIKYEVPVVEKLNIEGNTATVIATGSKTILYSIDGISYQNGNVFTNLPKGVTTFYLKFIDSKCEAVTKKGVILNVNNAFTPNGDGRNDTWIIDDLYVFDGQKSSLKVFDRYQKLIFQQDSNTRFEWDGRTNQRGVSTDSYWYIITLPDGRVINGWVLLKNRN